MPLFNGRLESKLCRKINIGGSQLDSMMMRLLQLKYACHTNSIDLRMAEYLQQKTCRLAIDYRHELLQWKCPKYVTDNSLKVQMAFKKTEKMLTNEQLEERKKQQALRGKEMHMKKNQEKMLSAQESLSNLKNLILNKDNSKKKALKSLGFETENQAMAEIRSLEETIEQLQSKISGVERRPTNMDNGKDQKSKFELVDVSDDELDDEQLKQKQKQVMLRAAAMRREQIRLMKEIQRNKILNDVSKLEESRGDDYALWVMNLRHQRQSLLDGRMKRRSSTSLATVASGPSLGIDERRQQKARKIRKLAAELIDSTDSVRPQKRGGQNIGTVANSNNNHNDDYEDFMGDEAASEDDSDIEQKQLTQLEILLGQYDPEFVKDSSTVMKCDIDEYYRLHLTTEQMRVPEIVFHPYMIGYEEAGLSEVLEHLINGTYLVHMPEKGGLNTRQLAENIFLTGSVSRMPHLEHRLQHDIRQFLPVSCPDPVIRLAEDPSLDAWRGACKLALHTQFESMSISRDAYEEMGHDYIQEHPLSNFFYTPLTDVDEISN